MTDNERLRKVIFWLISQGIIESQEDLAVKLGYNPSAVSQIVTGRKPLSSKFAKNICTLSDKISIDYLLTGEGEMLKEMRYDTPPQGKGYDTVADPIAGYKTDRDIYREYAELIKTNAQLVSMLKAEQESRIKLTEEIKRLTDIIQGDK